MAWPPIAEIVAKTGIPRTSLYRHTAAPAPRAGHCRRAARRRSQLKPDRVPYRAPVRESAPNQAYGTPLAGDPA